MNDKKFDKFLKNSLQKDKTISSKVDNVFLEYGNKQPDNLNKTSSRSFMKTFRYAIAVIVVSFVLFSGGLTYAHINGTETFISPFLRRLGINSKYEENATSINEKKEDNSVKIQMRDMALDESALIVGYTVDIGNIDNWIQVYGDYTINSIHVQPASMSIEKDGKSNYILYQIFDISDIQLKDKQNITFISKFEKLDEYTEVEDLYAADTEILKEYKGIWEFEKTMPIQNVSDNKEYAFENKLINFAKNVHISVDSYRKSSYTNMLRIKMDKEKYNGDGFEYYYVICDQNGNEIAAGVEEKTYDDRVYYDRLFISNIDEKEILTLKIFITNNKGVFKNVGNIEFNLSEGTEKSDSQSSNQLTYTAKNYSFQYKEDWKFLDNSILGPNSTYKDALIMELPTTSKSGDDNGGTIFIKETNGNLNTYVENLIESHKKEYYEITEKADYVLSNQKGYKITGEISDGSEDTYQTIMYVCEKNGVIYEINVNGAEKELYNQQQEIEKFVQNFKIK